MLAFLRNNKEASVAAPVESVERKPDSEPEYDPLESAAQDLCDAVHSKDIKGIAMALKSAFDMLDSQPHQEGPHI